MKRFTVAIVTLITLIAVALGATAIAPHARTLSGRLVISSTTLADITAGNRDGLLYRHAAQGEVLAGIVTHHTLVSPLMTGFFLGLPVNPGPRRVVVIGPDHDNLGRSDLTTTRRSWIGVTGTIDTDTSLVDALVSADDVRIDDAVARNEHGVNAILPFIHQRWPNTKVVTITVKYATTPAEAERLTAFLTSHLDTQDLVLASADFSHYKTLAVANSEDQISLAAIQTIDPIAAQTIPADSPMSISIVLQYAQAKALKYQLLEHLNSADYLKEPALQSTTSYISGYFLKP